MQTIIANAFAKLNRKMHDRDQAWAAHKMDTAKEFVERSRAEHTKGGPFDSGFGRFDSSMAIAEHFGGVGMASLLCGHGRDGGLKMMAKNTDARIAKRDAQIMKALNKKGVTSIPSFTLVECSDGFEGSFNVSGHIVTIRSIVAGGYNVQRLHVRTLVEVK